MYSYFRHWRNDGTWVKIHDCLRAWVRVDNHRAVSPSEAIVDSQSVKNAAMVSQAVGYDAGKQIRGRKRFLTVDTLGLVLRVFVTAASVGEREGGKQVLAVRQADGKGSVPPAYDLGRWWLRWQSVHADGDGSLPLDCAGRVASPKNEGFSLAPQTLGGRTHFGLAERMSTIEQRL